MVKNDDISKLYGAMVAAGYDVEDLGGSEEDFRASMGDAQVRKDFYDWISANEKGGFRIGEYDEYEKRLTAQPKGGLSAMKNVQDAKKETAEPYKFGETIQGMYKPMEQATGMKPVEGSIYKTEGGYARTNIPYETEQFSTLENAREAERMQRREDALAAYKSAYNRLEKPGEVDEKTLIEWGNDMTKAPAEQKGLYKRVTGADATSRVDLDMLMRSVDETAKNLDSENARELAVYLSMSPERQASLAPEEREKYEGWIKDVRKKEALKGTDELYTRIADLKEKQRVSDIKAYNEYEKNRGVGGWVKDALLGIPVAEAPHMKGKIPSSGFDITPEGVASKEANDALTAAGRYYNKSQKMIQAAQSGNFFQAMEDALTDIDTWSPEVMLQDNLAIQRVANKYEEEGEGALTENEKALLDALAMNAAVTELYGGDISNWANAGTMVGQMAPFMIEMVLNPLSGLSRKAAAAVTKRAVKTYGAEALKKGFKNVALGATRGLAKAGGAVVGGTGMALTTGLPAVGADTQKRMLGDVTYGHEDGKVKYTGHTEGEGLFEAAGGAIVSRAIDNATEMFGAEYASKMMKGVLKPLAKTKVGGWLDNIANSRFGKAAANFSEKTNWNGPIEEFLEEMHAGLLGAAVGEHKLAEFFTPDNIATIALGVSIPGVAMSTMNTVQGIKDGALKAGAQERWKMENADAIATRLWQNPAEWKDLRNSLTVGTLEETEEKLKEVYNDKNLTPEQKVRAFEYAIYNLQYRTARNVAEGYSENAKKMIDPMLRDIYGTSFAEYVSPRQANKAFKAMEEAGKRATESLGLQDMSIEDWLNGHTVEEATRGNKAQAEAVQAYLNAKADFEGKRDRFQFERERAYTEADNSIDEMSNNGMVYSTEMDGEEVFITGGNVVLNENGTVDIENSSEVLYIRRPDGSVRSVACENIPGEVTFENAENLKAARRAEIDEKWRADFDAAETISQGTDQVSGQVVAPAIQQNPNDFTLELEGEQFHVQVEDGVVKVDGEPVEWDAQTLADARAKAGIPNEEAKAESGDTSSPVEQAELSNETVQPQVAITALEQIPRNENNVPLYEQVDSELAWDGVVEEAGGNEETAMVAVNSMVEDKKKALAAAEKAKARAGVTIAEKIAAENERVANIEKAKADLAKWEEIAGVKAKRAAAQAENVAQPVAETAPVESAPVEDNTPQSQSDSSPTLVEQPTPQATNEMQPVSEEIAPTAEEIADAQAFAEASSQNTVEAYQEYLDKFPEGAYREGARAGAWMIEGINPETHGQNVDARNAANAVLARVPSSVEEELTNPVKTEDVNTETVATGEEVSPVEEIAAAENKGESQAESEENKEEAGLFDAVTDVTTPEEFIALHLPKLTPESFKAETGLSNHEQRQMVGFIAKKENGGVSVERASELLMDGYGDELKQLGFHGDDTDVRNIIIDILQEGNPRSYVKKVREQREAERLEYERAQADAWAKEQGFESIEEMEAYEEQLMEIYKAYDNHAQNIAAKLNLTITTHTDEFTVTNKDARMQIVEGGRIMGWYNPNTGEIALFLPSMDSMKDVEGTILHEAVAHYGIKRMLGKEKFNEFLDQVWEMMPAGTRAHFLQYVGADMKAPTQEQMRAAADEYVAYIAEGMNLTEVDKSIWDKILEFFIDSLAALGFKNLTRSDVERVIKASYRNLALNKYDSQVTSGSVMQSKKLSERREEKNRINNVLDEVGGIIYGNKEYAKKQRLKREAERKELAKEMYSSVLKGDFNDVTLSQIDKFIEDATPANPFGRRISQRLPQRMERALRQGARANAVDALFSRISESAVPANERFSEAGRRKIEERKKELLKGWAIATGNWHTDLKEFTDDTEPIGEGKDSKVYSSKDGRYVIKASKGKPFGKRFRPDIDNIALFNDVFRDTRYEILGYGEIDGEFVRILQQPIVDFAESTPLTSEERREYMQSLGFKPLNDANTAFADGEIVIADLQKGNVVRDAAGNISVIDADAKLHTKDVGGDYTYPPVETDLPEGTDLGGTMFRKGNPTLLGTHSITEDKLRKAIRMGGLANPSTAVFELGEEIPGEYGEITFVMPSSMVDKKTGRNTGAFAGDAWTPTYPQVERQMGKRGSARAREDVQSVPKEMQKEVRMGLDSWLDGREGAGLAYLFLQEEGLAPELSRVAQRYSDEIRNRVGEIAHGEPFYRLSPEQKQEIVDLYIEQYYNGDKAYYSNYLNEKLAMMQEKLADVNAKSFIKRSIQQYIDGVNEYGFDYEAVSNFLNKVQRDIDHSGVVNDRATTQEAARVIREKGLEREFQMWKEELLDRYEIKEVIFKGFTPTGNRRYVPHTLENVSKDMKEQGRNGAVGLNATFNKFAAGLLKPLGSLDAIRKRKGNLRATHADTEAFRDKWSEVYYDLAEKLQPDAKGYEDYGLDRVAEAATKKDPKAFIKSEYGIELSEADEKALKDMVWAIQNEYPVMYFETKFERPVYLDEFAGVVIPENTGSDVVESLENAGLKIETYEPGNEKARAEAIKRLTEEDDRIMFRFTDADRQAIDFRRTHKGSANIVVIDTDMMTAGLLAQGFNAEEIVKIRELHKKGSVGFYSIDRNTIYLLGKNLGREENEGTFWHENTHKAIVDLDVPQEILDEFYSMPSEEFIKKFEELAIKGYNPEDYPEEFMAYYIEHVRDSGRHERSIEIMGVAPDKVERVAQIVEPIINYINYGRRRVDTGTERVSKESGNLRDSGVEALPRGEKEGTRLRDTRFSKRESIDDIPTQPLTLVERVKNSLLEAAAKNKENLKLRADALRTYGRDVANVLKLMGKQREYDKSTVDTLMKLAKMYFKHAQLLGGLTPHQVGGIMTRLNNAVGKEDITNEANNLMNILLDAHAKALDDILEKAEKIKAKKVNAAGVEVMGSLDKYAQETIGTYRDSKGWDQQLLDESIIDSANRLAEAEDKVRKALGLSPVDDIDAALNGYVPATPQDENAIEVYKMERARFEGFDLAREYRENVHHYKAEISQLKQELKDADLEVKKGNIDRKAYNEQKRSIEDSILQSKAEMIDGYHGVISRFTEDVRGGRARAKQFVQEQVDRARDIQHNANSDMEGNPANVQGARPDKWNSAVPRLLMSAMPTFQNMLKKFGEKAVDGKGYLYSRFMPQATQAADKEFRGKVSARLLIEAKLEGIYDKKMSIEKFMNLSRKHGVTISYKEGGVEKSFDLNKGQMLYIYMVNKMADGQMKLRKMGITEDLVADIAERLDPKMVRFADWAQNELLTDLRGKYNEVHERMFGAPMASIDNYFPLKIKKEARGEKADVGRQDAEEKPSTVTGSIIKRTKNATAIDLSADAMSVLIEHIDNMEHWAAFAEFNRDLNTLLNYRHFQNQVKGMTTIRYGSGDVLWKNFQKVAAIASGEYRPKASEVDKAVMNIAKGITRSKINFRTYTAVKQLLSAPAFWNEAGFMELMKAYRNPMGSWNWALENLPGFKERWEGRTMGNEKLMPEESDWKIWRNKFVENATKWGMAPNAAIDAMTVAQGARAVYLTKLQQFKKAGFSHEQANAKALQAAAEAYNESQQSSEGAYLAPIQKDGTVASAILTTFKNSNFGYTRKTAQAVSNILRKMHKGYKEETIAFMAKKLEREGLTPEQAKAYATKIYKKSKYKDVVDVAMFGFGLNILWELGGIAIYLMAGDDDETKEKMREEAALRGALGVLNGIPGGETIASGAMAVAAGDANLFRLPELVAVGDVRNLVKVLDTDMVKGVTDLINMLTASGIGVNPQVITDLLVAIGDFDPEEFGMFVLRAMAAPTSQTEQLEVDKAMEDNGKRLEEIAVQYVEYKKKRQTPLTGWMYTDEGEQKAMERYAGRFDKMLDERLEKVVENTDEYQDMYEHSNPYMKEKLSKMRKAYLEGNKEVTFEKLEIEELINRKLYGANYKDTNVGYFNLTTSEDEDMAYLIDEKLKALKPVYDEARRRDGEEFYNAHKEEIDLYVGLNDIKNAVNANKKLLKENPTEEAMNEIRRLRNEAIDLMNK